MSYDRRSYLQAVLVVLFSVFVISDVLAQRTAIVTTTDFATGSLATISPEGEVSVNILLINSDATVVFYSGLVYVINRFGADNILVLDPEDLSNPKVQHSVGNGTNPQDIEFASPDKAYVSRLNSAELLIIDPKDGNELGQIDLSAFADSDGIPEIAQMAMVGDKLFVTCQRLENFAPTDKSVVVVIDTKTDTIVDVDPQRDGVQAIDLAVKQPFSLDLFKGKLYLVSPNAFFDKEGGIEVVDPATFRTRGVIVSEESLGGDITGIAMLSEEKGYAVVSDESFNNFVKPFNPETGEVSKALEGHSGGSTPNIAIDNGLLYVPDRSITNPGILIYDTVSDVKIAGPIDTGLPPFFIAFIGDEDTGTAVVEFAGVDSTPEEFSLGQNYPNPFNPSTAIPYSIAGDKVLRVNLDLYNSLGQRVASLLNAMQGPGRYLVLWDGKDGLGNAVSSGIYVARLKAGSFGRTIKLTVSK